MERNNSTTFVCGEFNKEGSKICALDELRRKKIDTEKNWDKENKNYFVTRNRERK